MRYLKCSSTIQRGNQKTLVKSGDLCVFILLKHSCGNAAAGYLDSIDTFGNPWVRHIDRACVGEVRSMSSRRVVCQKSIGPNSQGISEMVPENWGSWVKVKAKEPLGT